MPNSMLSPHLDAQALRDWPLYGPQDPAIAEHIERLAYEGQMRLRDIEKIILDALKSKLPD